MEMGAQQKILARDIFPAKILLFGEYLVLEGSAALAFPYPHFFGSWSFQKNNVDARLVLLSDYIKEQAIKNIDVEEFDRGIKQGLVFQSSIPVGSGLGSSGSLVAAVLSKYGYEVRELEIVTIHPILRQLENYYHGNSSGFDPLVSYFNKPIIFIEGKPQVVEEEINIAALKQLFVLDSSIQRNSRSYISYFNNTIKCKTNLSALKDLSDNMVQTLSKDEIITYSTWKEFSKLQLHIFHFMIPKSIHPIWQFGLDSGLFSLKLCGAGGGGLFLGSAHVAREVFERRWPFPQKISWVF